MTKLTKQTFFTRIKEYLIVTLAGILNAVSLYSFVNPSKLIAGGFSGLSSALTYVFYKLIPTVGFDDLMSIIYFILNIPLLICALVFLRGDFTFKTIWSTLVCTGALAVLPKFFPKFEDPHAKLIAIAFGGILIGVSMYIASEVNGSNGGTEIIAKIVSKYHPEIDLSKVLLVANLVITCTGSVIVMAIEGERLSIVIYSMLYIFMGTTVFGMFKRGFNHPQKFIIVTTEYEQLMADITERFKRGCSCMDVLNSDPDKPRKIVMVVVQFRQAPLLKQIIHRRDPNAFTIVKEVYDVFSRPTFNRSYKTK